MGAKRMAAEKQYDIVVAGAGVAGVAAAVAAARAGCRTALIEKTILPGGLATAGNVLMYLPLCDGRGVQVTCGLAEELLKASLRYGPGQIPDDWQKPESPSRLASRFSPASFVLALDELLEQTKVDIWYDTLVCSAAVTRGRLGAVEVENKSGRVRISASCFVDATGDADIASRAGVPCMEAENYLVSWSLQASLDSARRAAEQGTGAPLLDLLICGGSDTGLGHPRGTPLLRGTSGANVSRFVLGSRRLVRDHYRTEQARRGATGRSDSFPLCLPSMADFRTTRRIRGMTGLDTGDCWEHFDDSVGLVADWRGGGGTQKDVWEVRYGSLVPAKVKGLLVAGRCIAAAGEAWQVMRVIPGAAQTGEIAGVAAALAVSGRATPDVLDNGALRAALRKLGLRCSLSEVYGDSWDQRARQSRSSGSWDHG